MSHMSQNKLLANSYDMAGKQAMRARSVMVAPRGSVKMQASSPAVIPQREIKYRPVEFPN